MAEDFGGNDVGSPVQSCPADPESTIYWLEIEMVDENDQPAPYMEFKVLTPEGKNIKGYLDATGWARLDGLKQVGQYQIIFPDLDLEAWDYLGSAGARGGAGAS